MRLPALDDFCAEGGAFLAPPAADATSPAPLPAALLRGIVKQVVNPRDVARVVADSLVDEELFGDFGVADLRMGESKV